MNILWHKFEDLIREVAATQGFDYDAGQVENPGTVRKYAQALGAAVEIAWKFHAWPGCCWVMNAAVYDPSLLCEKGYDVLALYSEEPLTAWNAGREPKTIPLRETSGRYLIQGDALTTPYYLIRTAPPRFGTAARSTSTAYEAGALIYDSATGEAWRCVTAHTDVAPATAWEEWADGGTYSAASGTRIRRNGVLWDCSSNHDSISATNEPGFGSAFWDVWSATVEKWAPQRLPHFLLQAVLHGARAWLHETPPLPRSALEKQMEGWLASEVDDLKFHRRQFFAAGGGLTIL